MLTDQAVQSVYSQELPNTEVIVVDDGSRDGTAQWMAEHHPEAKVLRNEQSTGFSATANRGLRDAKGQILLLLNSDTVLAEHALLPMLEAFEKNPELGIAGAALQFPDGAPQWSGGKFPTLAWVFALTSGIAVFAGTLPLYRKIKKPGSRSTGSVEWVTGAAMAIRKSVWNDVGPLDENYRFYGQDLDLCRKAGKAGWKISIVPDFVVTHHHGATISEIDGATDASNPEFLWTDILRFITINDGPGAARRTRWVMLFGANLRLFVMALAQPFGSPHTRELRRKRRSIYQKATHALRQFLVIVH